MHLSVRSALLLLPVFAALAGCSSDRPPKVDIAQVTVAEQSPEGFVLSFTLDAANDNDDPLPLKLITYRLSLDGREVFRGIRSPEATLPSHGAQQIRVPAAVRLSADQAPAAGTRTYVLSGHITYLVPGKIAQLLFDNEVSQPEARFSGSGDIEIPALP